MKPSSLLGDIALPKHIYKKIKGLESLDRACTELSPTMKDLHRLYKTNDFDFNSDIIRVGGKNAIDKKKELQAELESLRPIRKGKYQIFDTFIDSEWDCSIRFNKIKSLLDWQGKTILDVGCNNGYYGLRALGLGAGFVLGTDINEKVIRQSLAFTGFIDKDLPLQNIHLDFLSLPEKDVNFDIILYMGVLYHARDPLGHLMKLNHLLDKNATIVIETIVPNDDSFLIFPTSSYANMKNVWFVAGVDLIKSWLIRTGFTDIELVEQRPLLVTEQKRTFWADCPSLEEQKGNDGKTIEGLPFYDRALIFARKNK